MCIDDTICQGGSIYQIGIKTKRWRQNTCTLYMTWHWNLPISIKKVFIKQGIFCDHGGYDGGDIAEKCIIPVNGTRLKLAATNTNH